MSSFVKFFTFLSITPLVIFVSIVFFSYRVYRQEKYINISSLYLSKNIAFDATPSDQNLINIQVNSSDIRVEKLYYFFSLYNSPLKNYVQQLITDADKYGLDYRFLPAIAMQESGGCAKIIANSYNCWGWGITKTKTTKFSSFSEAIYSISRQFAHNYYDRGLNTPESVANIYNPATPQAWASHVEYFMNQI